MASTKLTYSPESGQGGVEQQQLRRALGICGKRRPGNRNHMVMRLGARDHEICMGLVKQGHMLRIAGSAYNGWVDVFVVTDTGRRLAQRTTL